MIEKNEKVLALIASFLFFPVGIVFFIVWFGNDNLEKRKLGKQCMILSLFPFLFFLLFVILGIINFYVAPTHFGSGEETTFDYTFTGEGEYWEAAYSFSGTKIWKEEDGVSTFYSTDSSDELVISYKGDLTELSSLKLLEYSYETSVGGGAGEREFDEPPTDVIFKLTGSATNAEMVSEDEVIQVNVKWDGNEESFELHNTSYEESYE